MILLEDRSLSRVLLSIFGHVGKVLRQTNTLCE